MKKILIINGPNLNLLGNREDDIYGKDSLEKIKYDCKKKGVEKKLEIIFFQSNNEGEIIDKIHEMNDKYDGLIINPAARKLAAEKEIDVALVTGTGRDGRITKEDVVKFSLSINKSVEQVEISQSAKESPLQGERQDRRVPMTRMRARIAERLLAVKQETAMLTTFNEVDMSALMNLRKEFQEEFTKAHNGTKLGFMGLFVKASVEALKRFPIVNASIDGTDIVYHGYQDIGVAVSTERGLVVPILRNAENLSIAEIEMNISGLAMKARDSKLSIEEMSGGTFTITNGGIYGSLLSTPILNPPQSAILGMHAIQERPISVAGEVCVRPMMNLALSYDHRLVDGKDAVKFLVCIKQLIENPSKICLLYTSPSPRDRTRSRMPSSA